MRGLLQAYEGTLKSAEIMALLVIDNERTAELSQIHNGSFPNDPAKISQGTLNVDESVIEDAPRSLNYDRLMSFLDSLVDSVESLKGVLPEDDIAGERLMEVEAQLRAVILRLATARVDREKAEKIEEVTALFIDAGPEDSHYSGDR